MMLKFILLGLLATSAFAGKLPKRGGKGHGSGKQDAQVNEIFDDLSKIGGRDGSDSGSHDDDSGGDSYGEGHGEPLHAEEFQVSVSAIKHLLLNASDLSVGLASMAAGANADVSDGNWTEWDNIREDFDGMAMLTYFHFKEAEDTLWELADKLYTNPGDFSISHTCNNFSTFVAENSDDDDEFIFEENIAGALVKMQEDIECFHGIYEEAREIPDDTMSMAVEDAFDLVAETYKRVFRLRTAGVRFHKASMKIARAEANFAANHANDEVHLKERVLLKRLLTLLTKSL